MRCGTPQRGRTHRGLLGILAILALGLTACRIPSPLTYPLQLASPVDALDEVLELLADPPAPAQTPNEVATRLAVALTRQSEGCEVLTVAQVIWVAPTAPAQAAIEVRGLCDDAVDGIWYQITIGDDLVVTAATKQQICGRGVSGSVCV